MFLVSCLATSQPYSYRCFTLRNCALQDLHGGGNGPQVGDEFFQSSLFGGARFGGSILTLAVGALLVGRASWVTSKSGEPCYSVIHNSCYSHPHALLELC